MAKKKVTRRPARGSEGPRRDPGTRAGLLEQAQIQNARDQRRLRALVADERDKERVRRKRERGEITDAEVSAWLLGRRPGAGKGRSRDPEVTLNFYGELTGQVPGLKSSRSWLVLAPSDDPRFAAREISGRVQLRSWTFSRQGEVGFAPGQLLDAVLIVAKETQRQPANCLRDLRTLRREARAHVDAVRSGKPCPLCARGRSHAMHDWVADMALPTTQRDVPAPFRKERRGFRGSLVAEYLRTVQPKPAVARDFLIAGFGFDYVVAGAEAPILGDAIDLKPRRTR